MSNTGNYHPDINKAVAGLVSILAIQYHEPEYINTRKCIEATGLPVVYVERNPKGVGSLAEAINRGMAMMTSKYVFIVTNVTFDAALPLILASHIGEADIIHPSFNSDHAHLRQRNELHVRENGVGLVPFVEFTAPLVNRLKWLPVDESMPYWGFDLDHGWRVWDNGGIVLCDYTCTIGHTYIRNSKDNHNMYTRRRKQRRRMADIPTKNILKHKYGARWDGVLFHKKESDIGRFIRDVVEKKFPEIMPKKIITDMTVTHISTNIDGSVGIGYLVEPRDVIHAVGIHDDYSNLLDAANKDFDQIRGGEHD